MSSMGDMDNHHATAETSNRKKNDELDKSSTPMRHNLGCITRSWSSVIYAVNQTIMRQKQNVGCITRPWSSFTHAVNQIISRYVVASSMIAARNPKRTIVVTVLFSFLIIIVGFCTNFNVQLEYETVFAPFGSLPLEHKAWLVEESGFPQEPRPVTFILHYNEQNILGREQVDLAFEALDTVRDTPGYQEICSSSPFINSAREHDCKIFGITNFWDNRRDHFQEATETDEDTIDILSSATFPGGTPVYTEFLLGHAQREGNVDDEAGSHNGTRLTSAKSFLFRINFPDTEGIKDFEVKLLDRLGDLQSTWEEDPEVEMNISYFSFASYELEFQRAIDQDLILVPVVMLIMSIFTSLVFYKRDRVQSRSLLGIGAIVCIGLGLMTGYGLMFVIGVPFTSTSQILPFVVFGVGLDDTFIITGAYFRTDPGKDTVERIQKTMLEVGQSIALTTITTMLAFMLGCISTIPSIRWVCIYAFPTIMVVFLYQITFFAALLVLDERRVKANCKDICFWSVVENQEGEKDLQALDISDTKSHVASQRVPLQRPNKSFEHRFMEWYSDKLMKPYVKTCVIVFFTGYLAFCIYCTTNLSQRFRARDFVPEGSYVSEFLFSLDKYSEQTVSIHVYFRNVNQSDPLVQEEMREYLNDLVKMPAVNGTKPLFCWLTDFEKYLRNPELLEKYEWVLDLPFADQVALALTDPSVREAYGDDIVIENGTIVASRCWLNPAFLDLNDVRSQTGLLADQYAVTAAQTTNKDNPDDLNFFTYDDLYHIWEFFTVATQELAITTVTGIIAVSVVSFILIEHWTATLFIFPMILMLYVELLGTLQCAGLYINVVTYVVMVVSIGLLVDFLLHIILRYYESPGATREAKVKETLVTMGVSIMLGGLSTFLGTIPLAFSTSEVLRTVFIGFFAMVTLGVTHGLILLPVILSLVGPLICTSPHTSQNPTTESKMHASKDLEDCESKNGDPDELEDPALVFNSPPSPSHNIQPELEIMEALSNDPEDHEVDLYPTEASDTDTTTTDSSSGSGHRKLNKDNISNIDTTVVGFLQTPNGIEKLQDSNQCIAELTKVALMEHSKAQEALAVSVASSVPSLASETRQEACVQAIEGPATDELDVLHVFIAPDKSEPAVVHATTTLAAASSTEIKKEASTQTTPVEQEASDASEDLNTAEHDSNEELLVADRPISHQDSALSASNILFSAKVTGTVTLACAPKAQVSNATTTRPEKMESDGLALASESTEMNDPKSTEEKCSTQELGVTVAYTLEDRNVSPAKKRADQCSSGSEETFDEPAPMERTTNTTEVGIEEEEEMRAELILSASQKSRTPEVVITKLVDEPGMEGEIPNEAISELSITVNITENEAPPITKEDTGGSAIPEASVVLALDITNTVESVMNAEDTCTNSATRDEATACDDDNSPTSPPPAAAAAATPQDDEEPSRELSTYIDC